jgi:hypothetical protein
LSPIIDQSGFCDDSNGPLAIFVKIYWTFL